MALKAIINSVPKNRISINKQQRETIRTVAIAPIVDVVGARYMNELLDVDATDPDTNETLVYDEASGKYIVKTLPVVNGGTF